MRSPVAFVQPLHALGLGRRRLCAGPIVSRHQRHNNHHHHHHQQQVLLRCTTNVTPRRCASTSSIASSSTSTTSAGTSLPPAPYIPRRTLLYVPGDDTRKLRKAAQLRCDFIALDCEDGVAQSRKQHARDTIRAFYDSNLNELPSKFDQYRQSEWSVRLNGVASGLCEEDLRVVVAGKRVPETLLLPKCESAAELQEFSDALRRHCTTTPAALPHRIGLIMYAESCTAIMNLPAICAAAAALAASPNCLFEPAGLVFGSDDLCASLGATRTASAVEVLYARQRVVLVAKAFGLQAIDMVHIDYKDAVGLQDQAEFGARMGYTGKQVIHPDQIECVQRAFEPSAERVEWAQGLLQAYAEHQRDGRGAFVYRNQMIDRPTMRQAQNIIDTMKNLKG